MPTLIRKLTPDGLEPVDYSADSLTEAVQYEPEKGVYTVTNTYHRTKTLKFDAHLDRLEDSASRANIALNLDRERLRKALRQMILESSFGDVRFRVTVPSATPDSLILTIEPFYPLSQDLIEQGVRVITAKQSARSNARAKTTGWMHDRKRLSEAMPQGIYDTLLLDAEGHILEGLGANFYAVMNNELRTASEDVLWGISRQIVLDVAPEVLPVVTEPVTIDDVPQLQEAFITSSSRAVVPVVEIDGVTIGDGTPGKFTREIRKHYLAWADAHLQEL